MNYKSLEKLRHSTAHVMAMAVQKLWPDIKIGLGPVIENGFYYDFKFPKDIKITQDNLKEIESCMKDIIDSNYQISKKVVNRSKAMDLFKNEPLKLEILKEIEDEITLYSMGDWFDLCKGPHISHTGEIKAFKLLSVAGAYWKNDNNNEMLTRIYATAWDNKKDLKKYLLHLEEAKKRDHRLLGKQLDLFNFHEYAAGSVFFHPNGNFLYNKLIEFIRSSNLKYGYNEISTPMVMDAKLWKTSGHYDNFKENLYFIEGKKTLIKPMNCPGHILIYKSYHHSYRDLPLKYSEFGRVYRKEKSGTLHGLFRLNTFVQDDAHTFCKTEDIEYEIDQHLKQIDEVYKYLGFEKYEIVLSTKPEKYIGDDQAWDIAEKNLKKALEKKYKNYEIKLGDGAFYGPKIDFYLIDSLSRKWQCGTIQLDLFMPERFDLSYIASDNKSHKPVMIHRAILGSLERFLAIFIENYNGHFPMRFAPVQIAILSISNNHIDYVNKINKKLIQNGFRSITDISKQKLAYKIRQAQLKKIPYMIIIGDNEIKTNKFKARFHDGSNLKDMSIDEFIELLRT